MMVQLALRAQFISDIHRGESPIADKVTLEIDVGIVPSRLAIRKESASLRIDGRERFARLQSVQSHRTGRHPREHTIGIHGTERILVGEIEVFIEDRIQRAHLVRLLEMRDRLHILAPII